LNQYFIKIIIEEESISVKRFYNSYSAKWETILEYGRDSVMAYGGYIWRYYININGYGDKKFDKISSVMPWP